MAEKGGKGFPVSRGKSALKTPASKLGSKLESLNLKGKDGGFSKRGRKAQVESSDCDSDDSVKEISGGSSKSGKKASRVNTKTSKKVSFENLKTGGKTPSETLSGKGDWGKGGSGDKTGKGGGKGRPPIANILTEVDLKLEVDLPKNAKILKDCEAAAMLQGIQDYLPVLSDDPAIKIPESFPKALKYVQTVDHYTDSRSVTQALQYPYSNNNIVEVKLEKANDLFDRRGRTGSTGI